MTTPARTFLDLRECQLLVEIVVTGDALLRSGRSDLITLRAAAQAPGRHCRTARRAAELIRERVDSPMETRVRLLLVLAGLPEPVIAHEVRDQGGGWLARVDLAYPELRIAIEYDGRQHLTDPRQWNLDIIRREVLERAGWTMIVITATDYYRRPDHTLGRIRDARAERGEVGLGGPLR